MDQDDAEKRIAELERQLAERKRIAELERQLTEARASGRSDPGTPEPTANAAWPPVLTAAEVRNVAFSKPPIGQRGYDQGEVDGFLQLVEAKLLNPNQNFLSAADVDSVAFSKPPIGQRGYNEYEVDAFLDRVKAENMRLDGQAVEPPPQFFGAQMVAGPQSVGYPGQGGPGYFGTPAGFGPQPTFPGALGASWRRRTPRWARVILDFAIDIFD
jgi:DivIVA domain-containing protein